jgi:hypothetical protein
MLANTAAAVNSRLVIRPPFYGHGYVAHYLATWSAAGRIFRANFVREICDRENPFQNANRHWNSIRRFPLALLPPPPVTRPVDVPK